MPGPGTEAKVKSSKVQVQEGVASVDDRMEWNKGKNGARIPEVIGSQLGDGRSEA